MYKGKPVETIDITPTWESVLHSLLAVIENGNSEGRKTAIEELKRMAKIADGYVELTNKLPDYLENYYNVVAYIERTKDELGTAANNRLKEQGTGGLYELAEDWTEEFTEEHKGHQWDGDYLDAIDSFLRLKG